MGIDDRRHCIGGVVEAVHELEAERNDQRDAEQKVRSDRLGAAAGRLNVGIDAVGHEEQAARQNGQENQQSPDVHWRVEPGLAMRWRRGRGVKIGDRGHRRTASLMMKKHLSRAG
jgi:hypothetical protein